MTGPEGQVLYIGQSGNLHARVASYKNACADHTPLKVLRLVHQVQSITWELCESPEAARLRENELLRLHRPRFNRLHTYPGRYSFVFLRQDGSVLELGRTHDTPGNAEVYGAFKSGVGAGLAALFRVIWAALHKPASYDEFPALLLTGTPRRYSFSLAGRLDVSRQREFLCCLREFLAGTSDDLLSFVRQMRPGEPQLEPVLFEVAQQGQDFETLKHFFLVGPQRNHKLRVRYHLQDSTIPKEELDDFLV